MCVTSYWWQTGLGIRTLADLSTLSFNGRFSLKFISLRYTFLEGLQKAKQKIDEHITDMNIICPIFRRMSLDSMKQDFSMACADEIHGHPNCHGIALRTQIHGGAPRVVSRVSFMLFQFLDFSEYICIMYYMYMHVNHCILMYITYSSAVSDYEYHIIFS